MEKLGKHYGILENKGLTFLVLSFLIKLFSSMFFEKVALDFS